MYSYHILFLLFVNLFKTSYSNHLRSSSTSSISTSVTISPSTDLVRFFVLGDWGKGGSTGAYGSSIGIEPDDDITSKEPGTMLKNGGIQIQANNNQKTFYQVAISKAMTSYAAKAHPKPLGVLALGDNFYNNVKPFIR